MNNLKTSDYLVTSVSHTNNTYDNWSGLLFYSNNRKINLNDKRIIEEICEDPIMQKIFPYGMIIHTPEILNADNHLLIEWFDQFNSIGYTTNDTLICLYTKETKLHWNVKLNDIFYKCTKPIKAMLGCEECIHRPIEKDDCIYKKAQGILANYVNISNNLTDNWNYLKNRKTKIHKFTYISPTLTSPKPNFIKGQRPFNEHDFSQVPIISSNISKGLKERWRISKYKKKVCPTCAVQSGCNERNRYKSTNYEIKYCKKPYSKDITDRILSNTEVNLTKKQILQLLHCSGELEKRYFGCKYFGTLTRSNHGVLTYMLNHVSKPSIILPNFKEIETTLKDYMPETWRRSCNMIDDDIISDQLLSTIIETASLKHSPTYTAGWRTVQYPVMYIAMNYTNTILTAYFTWGRSRYGSQILPWNLHISNLNDIYSCYGTLSIRP